jgi:hypothetical protein
LQVLKRKKILITNFRLSLWLFIDVNSVLGLLHHMVMGNVADASEVHVSNLKVEAACTFEISATSHKTTQCNHQ